MKNIYAEHICMTVKKHAKSTNITKPTTQKQIDANSYPIKIEDYYIENVKLNYQIQL